MRRRPGGVVRVLTSCARCGTADLFGAERVATTLPTADGPKRHELVVCRTCGQARDGTLTPMEAEALAVDCTHPVRVMAYVQEWGADPGRVQRTAEWFLGAERVAAERARLVAEREAREDRYAAADAAYHDARYRRWAAGEGEDDDLF